MRPKGDSTYAAITAVLAANIVLVFYIVSSIFEDAAEQKVGGTFQKSTTETRKDK